MRSNHQAVSMKKEGTWSSRTCIKRIPTCQGCVLCEQPWRRIVNIPLHFHFTVQHQPLLLLYNKTFSSRGFTQYLRGNKWKRWAFLSPFLLPLHTNSLSSCHSRLLKYADDFMLDNSYRKCCKKTKRGWTTTSLVLRLGVLIRDLS